MVKKTSSVKSMNQSTAETKSTKAKKSSGGKPSTPKKMSKSEKKFNFRTEYPDLYEATQEPSIIDVTEAHYFMVDGKGDPNTPGLLDEVMTLLYGVSYTLKMKILKIIAPEKDYVVPPSEGLWWIDGITGWSMEREKWIWTIMIRIPNHVTGDEIKQALELFKKTKNPSGFDRLYVKSIKEGQCAQVLHIGPYIHEKETIEKLHTYINQRGYEFSGKHHEIYLSDPRKVVPEKLKTIIREPIAKKS